MIAVQQVLLQHPSHRVEKAQVSQRMSHEASRLDKEEIRSDTRP